MPATTIDPKYSIGIHEMDAQHARWLDLIARFRQAAQGEMLSEAGFAAARQALDELIEYTRWHFRSEEQLLSSHGYPGVTGHQARHRELERHVQVLHDELTRHRPATPLKLNLLATVWLMEHIHQHDKEYARYLKERGVT